MASADEYRWKWNYRVREIFRSLTGYVPGGAPPRVLTNAEIIPYGIQTDLINTDIRNQAANPLTDALLLPRVTSLAAGYGVAVPATAIPAMPPARAAKTAILETIFPQASVPNAARITAARAAVGVVAAPVAPRAPAVVYRPTGVTPVLPRPAVSAGTDNIVLGANPPSLYVAIQDANIRALTRELSDSSYNPEQTFSVTINDPAGGGADGFPITTDLTPIQFAALKGLKGTVRYLLNNSTPDLSKTINGLTLKDAVVTYRKVDFDKDEIRYIFEIIEKATQDAIDDFTSGVDKDSNYGKSLDTEVNKKLAKKFYDREYDDLKSPKPLPTTAPKPTSTLAEDAKKAGTEDGSKDAPKNPSYLATTVPPKTPQEQESYGKAYDKAVAAYYGERDAKLNEQKDLGKLASQFSTYYAEPSHQTEVEKIYDNTYEKNRSKTSDLVKEAGYVGTYPPSETLLSGNFFGFGSELSKIVGFDMSGTTPKTDTDAKYKEGLVEFVKNLQSIIGQAKYAGYTDGRKKNAKYTTPGKISVNGKEYAIDFGKLNTRITDLPSVSPVGVIQETEESGQAESILTELRRMRDSPREEDSLQGMIGYLREQSETNPNTKIKQILKTIVVSQRGGGQVGGATKEEVVEKINQLTNETSKNTLLRTINRSNITQESIDRVNEMVDIFLRWQSSTDKNQKLKVVRRKISMITNSDERIRLLGLIDPAMTIDQVNILNEDVDAQIERERQDELTRLDALDRERAEQAAAQAAERVAARDAAQRLQTRKDSIKIKIDRFFGEIQTNFVRRLNNPGENLDTLEGEIEAEINTQKNRIRPNLNLLPDGSRKQTLQERLNSPSGYLYLIDNDIKNALSVSKQIDKLENATKRDEFLLRFNNLAENLFKVKTDVDKQVFNQIKSFKDKKSLISKDISSVTDGQLKTEFTESLNRPNNTKEDLVTLHGDVKKQLDKEKALTMIESMPDGAKKEEFRTSVNSEAANVSDLLEPIGNWISLHKSIKDRIWYIPDSNPGKAEFLERVGTSDTNLDQLQQDIAPSVPSWLEIVTQKTSTGMRVIGTAASTVGTAVGTAATRGATAVGTVASTVGTAVGTVASTVGTAVGTAATAVGKSVITGLGTVTTKSQLYNLVQQAFSNVPKYVTTKLKDTPSGVSPDDPSLERDIHPIKRVQAMYDREFERGAKEAMRSVGGTRRRTKKSDRFTKKKQGSKK